jgi:hypothetical protein
MRWLSRLGLCYVARVVPGLTSGGAELLQGNWVLRRAFQGTRGFIETAFQALN